MENYYYTCKSCGFLHIVPSYWMNFSAEESFEMEHISMKTGEKCPERILYLKES